MMIPSLRRGVPIFLGSATTVAAAYVLSDARRREAARQSLEGGVRFGRAFGYGALVMLDYKFSELDRLEATVGKQSEEYAAERARVDKRSALRLLHVCLQHGGIYTKWGQQLSASYGLSKEYTETLAVLQDRAQPCPFEGSVDRVLEEDLGRPWGEVFSEFDPEPLAAASLAQVHRARLREDGREVAVKVQYPHLRGQVASDLWAFKTLLSMVEFLLPDWGYTWLVPEFERSIRSELSFLQEAHNGERVGRMFASDPRLHIPSIVGHLSTDRVLVMEMIHGVRATDHAGLARLGVRERDVAAEVSRFFSEQCFVHGLLHCDPHPGNLMVRLQRPGEAASWQLVVLDHGMYRRLSPAFRAAYCRLWEALVTRDHALGQRACVELGLLPEQYEGLSLMLTYRAPGSSAGLGKRMSKEDVAALKGKYKDVSAGDINRFMQRLPRDMLFVFRSTNLVRGLNLELGGTSRQRFRIMGEAAIRGLVLTDARADFHAQAQQFLLSQPAGVAAAAVDVLVDERGPGGGPQEAAATPASAWSKAAAWVARWGTGPPTEPETYLNALHSHSLVAAETESEQSAHLGQSWWRRLHSAWRVARLEALLLQFDVLMSIAVWTGAFSAQDSGDGKQRRGRHGGETG